MDINVKIILYFVIFCCWLLNFSAMQGINRLLPAIKTYIFKFQSLMSTYTIIIIVLYLFVGDEVFVSINHSDLQKKDGLSTIIHTKSKVMEFMERLFN